MCLIILPYRFAQQGVREAGGDPFLLWCQHGTKNWSEAAKTETLQTRYFLVSKCLGGREARGKLQMGRFESSLQAALPGPDLQLAKMRGRSKENKKVKTAPWKSLERLFDFLLLVSQNDEYMQKSSHLPGKIDIFAQVSSSREDQNPDWKECPAIIGIFDYSAQSGCKTSSKNCSQKGGA